jgi:hypothetical protein
MSTSLQGRYVRLFCLGVHGLGERPTEGAARMGKDVITRNLVLDLTLINPLQFSCSRCRCRCGIHRVNVLSENLYLSEAISMCYANRGGKERHNQNDTTHGFSSSGF